MSQNCHNTIFRAVSSLFTSKEDSDIFSKVKEKRAEALFD